MDDVQQNLFQVTRQMLIDKDTLLIIFQMCGIYIGWYSDHMGYSAVLQKWLAGPESTSLWNCLIFKAWSTKSTFWVPS